MSRLLRNSIIVVAVLVVAVLSLYPPEKNLRLGKDLSGGVSLVYTVQMAPGENPDQVIPAIIEVLKIRVDPDGTADIAMVRQGRDRIEISLPLPNDRVKKLKQAFLDAIEALGHTAVDAASIERAMRLEGPARDADLERLGAGDPQRRALLGEMAAAYDAARAAEATYRQAVTDLETARTAGAEAARIDELTRLVDEQAAKVAPLELAYEGVRDRVLKSAVAPEDVRRAMERPRRGRSLYDSATGQTEVMPSPRDQAITRLKEQHADAARAIDAIDGLHRAYLSERRSLDDPADLKRLLAGAGVLDFRITVDPATFQDEADMRRQLRERGPRNARHEQVRWFKINRIENEYDDAAQLRDLLADPVGYFSARSYVVEEYDAEYWMLAWTTAESRLTRAEGDWRCTNAMQGSDQLGRPCVNFQMDARGGQLMGRLTGTHLGKRMAILLDDQVYTAPVLQGRIGGNGQISGRFPPEELQYLIRTLKAGSLHAKLSQEPISEVQLAPEFGIDRLRDGLRAGMISFGICAVFMVGYYFACGLIAVVALLFNCVLLIGIMGLIGAAFTLPGIAGVILAFAMAVDANVLIYERMREEISRGADLRTAVRLGYSRALSAIVDGNMTHLIVCTVLYFVGTAEIRGFALTMSIGVGTTLFTQLFVTRLIFDLLVEKVRWRRTTMLPMAVPGVQRALTLNVDWLRLRPVLFGVFALLVALGVGMIVVRGSSMLDTEFVGGTEIAIKLRDAGGAPMYVKRQDVADKVAQAAGDNPVLRELRTAEVIVVKPRSDGVTSDTFRIKSLVTDARAMQEAIGRAFEGQLGTQPQLTFDRAARPQEAPTYPIIGGTLGENIDRPEYRDDVTRYVGGVAILLENLNPPPSLASLRERLDQVRGQPDFQGTIGRPRQVIALAGTDQAVQTAAILVVDPDLSYFTDEVRWGAELRDMEWALTLDALTRPTTFLSAQTFSAAIAATFAAQAVGSIVLSAVIIIVFIWVRFGSIRFSLAAIVPTLMDCVTAVGLIAAAELVYDFDETVAAAIGLQPFKLDLTVVAALLTILGYSINDKIVVLDRIRENRGKLPYVTRDIVNQSINQTLSRTIMTGTTTILSTIVLYLVGGEGVRSFAYALGLGVIIGTFSSVAVGAPMAWSRRAEKAAGGGPRPPEGPARQPIVKR
ncbi:MAG: protein translocase subunit SecD [Phycisphaerales bacterium]